MSILRTIEPCASNYLLLFYAIECGLKSIYLRRHRLQTIDQIYDVQLRKSHDLALWVKELRLPASQTGIAPSFKLARDSQGSLGIEFVHQAWRYGVIVDVVDEQLILLWLGRVKRWIEENF